jgi:uncharacterized protein
MLPLDAAAREFLNRRRIAVAGVSRNGDTAANIIYRRLRKDGFEVFAVNPSADRVEGDKAWPSVTAIPGGVDAVVIGTAPIVSAEIVQQARDAGADYVWFHRSFGGGSVDESAVALAHDLGVKAIVGGCPMMHLEPVDPAHRCFKWWLGVSGKSGRAEGFAEKVQA